MTELGIKLSASGAAAVQGELSRVSTSLDKVSSAGSSIKTALAFLGGGLSLAGLTAFVRQGIDAADAADKVSQKTGLLTKEVAGMQLAFAQNGIGTDQMTAALSRMSVQIVEGGDAFDKLGVKTRNADGSVRGVKDVLYDTADAFENMENGAVKTSLAVDLFGKAAGPELIPLLNEGSDAMREMADMAAKLGLEVDGSAAKAADEFNDTLDLLGEGVKGISIQLASQLLPTLNSLAGAFLESMTEGDMLSQVADLLANSLKGLYTAGVLVVEAFNTVGKALGAAGAAIMAVLSGDFKGAMTIAKEGAADIKVGWNSTAVSVEKAWSTAGNSTITTMAKLVKGGKEVTTQTKAQEDASKRNAAAAQKQAEEIKKLTKAGDDYIKSLENKAAVLSQEITAGRSLNALEKEQIALTTQLREGKIRMTAETEAQARRQLKLNDQLTRHRELQVSEAKLTDEITADKAELVAALRNQTATLSEQVAQQREDNLAAEMGAAAYAKLISQRWLDEAALIDQTAATSDQSEELRKQAALLRERAELAQQGVVIEEARAAAEAWKTTTDSIGQGLTDSLFRAFESGKGFFKTMWDGIVNTFKTTVLKPVIQAVMAPITGAVGSLVGTSGANAAGGSGLGNIGGLGSLLGSLGPGLSAAGSLFSAGAGMTLSGGFGSAMGAAGAAIGNGSMLGGLSIGAGAVAPFAAAATALYGIYQMFKHERTPHTGAALAINADGTTTNLGKGWRNIGANDQVGTMLGGTFTAVQGLLQALDSRGAFGVGGGFADDSSKDGSWGSFGITRNGKTLSSIAVGGMYDSNEFADGEKGIKQYMAAIADNTREAIKSIGLPEWAADIFDSLGGAPTLDQLHAAAQVVIDTQTALAALSDTFAPLSGVFGRVADLSQTAQIELVGLAGGIEALMTKAASYVSNFYSAEEQAALSASSIAQALTAVGLDINRTGAGGGALDTKEEFRALVDSVDVSTTQGRQQLATLLEVSGNFAELVKYIGESGLSLAQIAGNLPGSDTITRAITEAQSGAEAGVSAADPAAAEGLDSAAGVSALERISADVKDGDAKVVGSLEALKASVEAGLASVADATRATYRLLNSWDDGGALVSKPAT